MVQTCNCLIILEVTRTQSPKTKNTLRALAYFKADGIPELSRTEVGIYKRKQENENSTKKAIKKKRKIFFLDRFLSRVFVFLFTYFLVFFYKFPPVL